MELKICLLIGCLNFHIKNNWEIKLKKLIKEYLYSTIIIIDNNKKIIYKSFK